MVQKFFKASPFFFPVLVAFCSDMEKNDLSLPGTFLCTHYLVRVSPRAYGDPHSWCLRRDVSVVVVCPLCALTEVPTAKLNQLLASSFRLLSLFKRSKFFPILVFILGIRACYYSHAILADRVPPAQIDISPTDSTNR